MNKNRLLKAATFLALLLTFTCPIFAKPSFRTSSMKDKTSGQNQNQNQEFKRDSEISRIDSLKAKKEDETMVALKNSKTDSLRKTDVDRYIAKVAETIDKAASDDFERVKMIHDLICLTIRYDDDSYWSGDTPSQESEDVFKSGYAVCEGFSSAFKRLCDELNITCRVV
ncbi:MAG: transglutaminase domain-containing protein, partial [Treponema sp.]|nr:transglutaminase domain-containing protein [Treponema sp.]